MITVKDLIKYIEMPTSEESVKVDEWLKIKVFPVFTRDKQGFEVPSWTTCSKLEKQLGARGFDVTTNTSHQGLFVYIGIPPQGE